MTEAEFVKMSDDTTPSSKSPRRVTLPEMVERVLYVNGWARVLVVEAVPGTRLWRIRARDTGEAGDFSEADVVGLYTEEELRDGRVTRNAIQSACRRFVLSRERR